MLRFLLLLVVVAAAADFTNPKPGAYEAKAGETPQAPAQPDLENPDIGGAIGNSAAQLIEGEYENFYLASRYSAPSAQQPRAQCYGAFTLVSCNAVARN